MDWESGKEELDEVDKKIIGAMRVNKEPGLNELADLLKDSVSKPTLIKRIERLDMKGIIRVEGSRRGQKSKIRLLQAKEGIVKEERKTRGKTKSLSKDILAVIIETYYKYPNETLTRAKLGEYLAPIYNKGPNSWVIKNDLRNLEDNGFIQMFWSDKKTIEPKQRPYFDKIQFFPFEFEAKRRIKEKIHRARGRAILNALSKKVKRK